MMNTLRLLIVGLAVATAAGGVAQAQVMGRGVQPVDGEDGQGPLPNRLASGVGVSEHLGAQVSPDLMFRDERGQSVRLASLLGGDKPVLLAFVYHSCPMLCSLVLDGVSDAVAGIDLPLGEDYTVLAVSIDPRDTPARADSAKARYVARVSAGPGGHDAAHLASGMHFWTVTPETEASVKQLADEVGFRYAYDVRTGEYGHNAVVVALSPTGMVSRYLYGISYPPRDVRLALVEAGEGKTGNTLDRFLLTCYEFDEHAQGYSLQILSVLKYLGGGMLLILLLVVGPLWLREVRRQRSDLALSRSDLDAPLPR
jgi:protein SCO1/2